MVRFGPTEELIQPSVRGTTNYSDIRPDDVLQLKLPLPPLDVQDKIIDEIDRQLRIRENAVSTLKALEDAAIDPSFFKSPAMIGLTEVAEINPNYELFPDSHYLFADMASIDELRGEIRSFSMKPKPTSGLSKFRDDDILFARITPCTENGKVALCKGLNGLTGLGSTELVVIKPNKDRVIPKWLYFYLKNHEVRKRAVEVMIGTTNRQRVPMSFFETLEIPSMTIAEQEGIVKELEGYIEAKIGLLKIIELANKAIKTVVENIYQIAEVGKQSQPQTTRINHFLQSN
jgi:restriction endonuclease S subunit